MKLSQPTCAFLCLLLAGCATQRLPVSANPGNVSSRIEAIIYSDLTKAQMLSQLAPLVQVGEKLSSFTAATKLAPMCEGFGGPGVLDCMFTNGLYLVVDPDGIIQIIRRSDRTVAGHHFMQMSISPKVFTWHGYARGYEN